MACLPLLFPKLSFCLQLCLPVVEPFGLQRWRMESPLQGGRGQALQTLSPEAVASKGTLLSLNAPTSPPTPSLPQFLPGSICNHQSQRMRTIRQKLLWALPAPGGALLGVQTPPAKGIQKLLLTALMEQKSFPALHGWNPLP